MFFNPIIVRGTLEVYHHGATVGKSEVVEGSRYLTAVT